MPREVTYSMTCVAATERALLLHLEGEDEDSAEWFPRSELKTDIDGQGDEGNVTMPFWLAQAKSFED